MKYFELNTQAAGSFGESVEFAGPRQERPPKVTRMAYDFELWPEDAISGWMSHYVITKELSEALQSATPALTGFSIGEVEITTESQFDELYGDRELPDFVWLKVEGTAGKDDFGLSANNSMVASERALGIIKQFPHKYLKLEDYSTI